MFHYYGYDAQPMFVYKRPRKGYAAEMGTSPADAVPTDTTDEGYATSAFFPLDSEGRYRISLSIMTADATCMIPLQCGISQKVLADTGADLLLLTTDSAQALGFDLDMITDNFGVQGIYGTPSEFKQVQNWVQIGNMKPLFVPMGMASLPEGLQENLMGARGILSTGKLQAVYDNTGVTYRINPSLSGGYQNMT